MLSTRVSDAATERKVYSLNIAYSRTYCVEGGCCEIGRLCTSGGSAGGVGGGGGGDTPTTTRQSPLLATIN